MPDDDEDVSTRPHQAAVSPPDCRTGQVAVYPSVGSASLPGLSPLLLPDGRRKGDSIYPTFQLSIQHSSISSSEEDSVTGQCGKTTFLMSNMCRGVPSISTLHFELKAVTSLLDHWDVQVE